MSELSANSPPGAEDWIETRVAVLLSVTEKEVTTFQNCSILVYRGLNTLSKQNEVNWEKTHQLANH